MKRLQIQYRREYVRFLFYRNRKFHDKIIIKKITRVRITCTVRETRVYDVRRRFRHRYVNDCYVDFPGKLKPNTSIFRLIRDAYKFKKKKIGPPSNLAQMREWSIRSCKNGTIRLRYKGNDRRASFTRMKLGMGGGGRNKNQKQKEFSKRLPLETTPGVGRDGIMIRL